MPAPAEFVLAQPASAQDDQLVAYLDCHAILADASASAAVRVLPIDFPRFLAGEILPALNRHIAISGIDLDRMTGTSQSSQQR